MNKFNFIMICCSLLLNVNSQSWLVEGNHQKSFELFHKPVELVNEKIFVSYYIADKTNNGNNVDSTFQYVEIRSYDGQLLNSKRIYKPDAKIYLQNAVNFNNEILILITWSSIITNNYYAGIQLIDENLNTVFEDTIELKNRSPSRNDISIESDTTAIILLNAESDTNEVDSTYFIRISHTGKILQYKTYYEQGGDRYTNIIDNFTDDSIAVFGTHEMLVLDRNFNRLFIKELPFFTPDGWGSLIKYKNNDFLMLKALINDHTNLADIGLLKFNKNFDLIKTVRIGDPLLTELAGWGNFYNPLAKNSIYMVGIPDSPPLVLVNVPIVITRLDTNLNVIWTKYYDNNHLNGIPSIYSTDDDGILIAGYKRDITDPSLNPIAFLMKIDSSGNFPIATNIKNENLLWSATVFPNPSPGYLTISIDESKKDLLLELYDESGCMVFHSKSLNVGKQSFDLNYLSNGIYFYSILFDGKQRAKGKWIKQ